MSLFMPKLSKGNHKTGRSVLTYSRLPGVTCPGMSPFCQGIVAGIAGLKGLACYAGQAVAQYKQTFAQWSYNANVEMAPELPAPKRNGKRTLLRIHVSGDFTSIAYIHSWIAVLENRPDVTAWAYTRSWRDSELRDTLEKLRALPNVQLFASMDPTISETPPEGWRVAWILPDTRAGNAFPCPAQTGRKADCVACRFCLDGKRNDVAFVEH
jgi:hypothetical protein